MPTVLAETKPALYDSFSLTNRIDALFGINWRQLLSMASTSLLTRPWLRTIISHLKLSQGCLTRLRQGNDARRSS
jgi:hypothetical protein